MQLCYSFFFIWLLLRLLVVSCHCQRSLTRPCSLIFNSNLLAPTKTNNIQTPMHAMSHANNVPTHLNQIPYLEMYA